MKWEYLFHEASITHVDALWKKRDLGDKSGRTTAEIVRDYGNEGWEMVNITPFSYVGGSTAAMLFTFKRPIEA